MKNIDTRHNIANEIAKYIYFEMLGNGKDGMDPETVRQHTIAVHEIEVATGFKDFKDYNSDWALILKNHLNNKISAQTGGNISRSFYFNVLSYVRRFLHWLRENDKKYSKIKIRDIDYLHATRKERNQAKATKHPESHDISDLLAAIRNMPDKTELEMRNKAMLSLFLLTTPRSKPIMGARLECLKYFKDYGVWAFVQDPRVQNTKYSKTITAFFIGDAQDIIENVIKWYTHLKAKGFKDEDYLFPKIQAPFTKGGVNIRVVTRKPIKSASVITKITRDALENCGLKYIRPHNFRHSMTRHVFKNCENSPRVLAALAENAGHKNNLSTLISSYGGNPDAERAELMKAIKLE